MDLTSDVNRRASRTGSKFNRALSDGSANQETIGIPLSVNEKEKIKLKNVCKNLSLFLW